MWLFFFGSHENTKVKPPQNLPPSGPTSTTLLTLQMPGPPDAIAEPDLVILQHANVAEVLPLRMHQDTAARKRVKVKR